MKPMHAPASRIAYVFTSKAGMLKSMGTAAALETGEDNGEPPPDLLAECDSEETIHAVQTTLEEQYIVYPVESDADAYEHLRRLKPDLVFNMAERLEGRNRESHIPTICEILGLAYTGSDPLTLGICLDKAMGKEILSYHHIANAPFITVENPEDVPDHLMLPAMVKPMYEGSSKGIRDNCLVHTREQLQERVREIITLYQQPVIVETFLPGREFTVGVLGNWPELEILPIVEIDHSSLPKGAAPIYSYEAKWIWDTPEAPLNIFTCPAEISPGLQQEIEDIVRRTWRVLGLRDWARIDVRLDREGRPHILEINPLPGILPNVEDNSCLPKAARAAGYTYSQLIHRVVRAALNRKEKEHEQTVDQDRRRLQRV